MCDGQGGKDLGFASIEVTPKMVDAGASELREKCYGQKLEVIAEDVFWAMVAAMSDSARARFGDK